MKENQDNWQDYCLELACIIDSLKTQDDMAYFYMVNSYECKEETKFILKDCINFIGINKIIIDEILEKYQMLFDFLYKNYQK